MSPSTVHTVTADLLAGTRLDALGLRLDLDCWDLAGLLIADHASSTTSREYYQVFALLYWLWEMSTTYYSCVDVLFTSTYAVYVLSHLTLNISKTCCIRTLLTIATYYLLLTTRVHTTVVRS